MEKDYGFDGLDVAQRVLLETSFDDAIKEQHPLAIILGGQPASGKTQLLNIYRVIFILIENLSL